MNIRKQTIVSIVVGVVVAVMLGGAFWIVQSNQVPGASGGAPGGFVH
jgi:ABC-type transporter Mla subunit MlaD